MIDVGAESDGFLDETGDAGIAMGEVGYSGGEIERELGERGHGGKEF